jgi:tetratricopeptide (TPR) repeat protein
MLYFNEHDYPNAAETLSHALKLHPNLPTAEAMLGMSDYQLGKYDKAEPLIRAAVKANPDDDQTEMILANLDIKLRKYSEAADTLNHFLNRNPKDQEAWYACITTTARLSSTRRRSI